MKKSFLYLAILSIIISGCSGPQQKSHTPATIAEDRTEPNAFNLRAPIRPDPKVTPGAVLPVTVADISRPGYTKLVRNVPKAVKDQVYSEYGIQHHAPGEYEVDHLISLELGGSNDIKNLWPQSHRTQPWNADVKDQLENELHRLIVTGKVDMLTAQREISTDWIAAYQKYFHTQLPKSETPTAGHEGDVWINTNSGKYFMPGSAMYGKTKHGAFMSQDEAQRQGFVPAKTH